MKKVKICGLRRKEDILIVNRLKPDYVGFVFADSSRKVTKEEAKALSKQLEKEICPVGVFVNEEPKIVAQIANAGIIDLIQLHGEEDEAYIQKLKAFTNKPIIKAVRVRSREQIQKAEALSCDYLLFDTYIKGQYGGSGKPFDISLIGKVSKPYFIAGGLSESNVAEKLKNCDAFAADVSSAVETDGYKDEKKVQQFIEAVRKG